MDNSTELYKKLYALKAQYRKEWDNGFSRAAFFLLDDINQIEKELGLELTRC